MDISIKEIKQVVKEVIAEIQAIRNHLHQYPEPSFKEFNTSAFIAEKLNEWGISPITGMATTGLVVVIEGNNPSLRTVALRADMDALPINETAAIDYKSKNPGVMHACGHDGHMAGLLGAAKVIYNQKDNMNGVVKLIFQPAEEGYGGAREMIKDGCLEDNLGPYVDQIYGIHLWSYDNLGCIGCNGGPIMAASDKFEINVYGKGGHGAAPQGTVDAIIEAASLITALQTVVSRNKDPLESGVITCGTINGGFGYNVIADHVKISGTARSFTKSTQQLIKCRMGEICCGVAGTYGGKIDLNYQYGYPPTVNSHPECVEVVVNAATKIVGKNRASLPQKTMGAEDFSYFMEVRPGLFLHQQNLFIILHICLHLY